jgi:hypothetical protein
MAPQLVLAIADRAQSQRATTKKQPHLGIIPISILDLCVNQRQSLVIGGPRNSLFLTADEGR